LQAHSDAFDDGFVRDIMRQEHIIGVVHGIRWFRVGCTRKG
jgi:hypothetical protein